MLFKGTTFYKERMVLFVSLSALETSEQTRLEKKDDKTKGKADRKMSFLKSVLAKNEGNQITTTLSSATGFESISIFQAEKLKFF